MFDSGFASKKQFEWVLKKANVCRGYNTDAGSCMAKKNQLAKPTSITKCLCSSTKCARQLSSTSLRFGANERYPFMSMVIYDYVLSGYCVSVPFVGAKHENKAGYHDLQRGTYGLHVH